MPRHVILDQTAEIPRLKMDVKAYRLQCPLCGAKPTLDFATSLTQHPLAAAAQLLLRHSARGQTGRSRWPGSLNIQQLVEGESQAHSPRLLRCRSALRCSVCLGDQHPGHVPLRKTQFPLVSRGLTRRSEDSGATDRLDLLKGPNAPKPGFPPISGSFIASEWGARGAACAVHLYHSRTQTSGYAVSAVCAACLDIRGQAVI